jgi:hypothetical protein
MTGRWRGAIVARASRMTSSASSARHLIHETLFGPGIGKSGWSVIWYLGVTMLSTPGPAG